MGCDGAPPSLAGEVLLLLSSVVLCWETAVAGEERGASSLHYGTSVRF